jgi:hypothetical protein
MSRSDGTGLRRVGPACTGHRFPAKYSDNSYPAISRDRKQIAFVHAFGEIRDDLIDHVGIYLMRANGANDPRPSARRARPVHPLLPPRASERLGDHPPDAHSGRAAGVR